MHESLALDLSTLPSLPAALRTFRARLTITQVEASRWAGVTPETWSRWERGVLMPHPREHLRLLASTVATHELGEHARAWMVVFQSAYADLEQRQAYPT